MPLGRRMVLALLLAGLCNAGCAGTAAAPRNLPKSPVSGEVTYKGQPLPNGTVVFQHSSGEMVTAKISEGGKYEASVPEGENKVIVQSFSEPERPNPDPNAMPHTLPPVSRIPQKYGAFSSSGLSMTVTNGANKYDVALKD